MSKKDDECKACIENMKKFEELKNDYVLITNQLRLLQADFDNYKKRVIKEKSDLADSSKIELLAELLPHFEIFKKASDLSTDEGFKMLYKNFMKVLSKSGLEEIKSIGEKFDINFHEAMVSVKDESKDDGIIIDEVEKGYIFNKKLIKPSKVIVNKN
ncbi:MAG: nucleotide exchange factor GrpE [Candidatus Nanoarchaeia archaeon]|nr:nucleotide exchange factor GrpE [Candidatus Nanoarchaeia archaeon]